MKATARIIACGNFEAEDLFTHLSNRSEVPDAFMLRALLSYGAGEEWSIGSADLSTAFLNAELNDNEDGIYLVTPPKFLVDLGIEEEHVVWKLNNALYGLKRAPKKWELTRNEQLKKMQFDPEADGSYKFFEQCPNGNNIWKIKLYHPSSNTSELIGLMLLCVDDTFTMAPTSVIQSALAAIHEHWK